MNTTTSHGIEAGRSPARSRGLRRRISAGFALVLLLHLMVVALSYLVLNRGAESADRAAITRDRVAGLLAMDKDVETLQGNVLSFMYTGDSKLAIRATEDVVELSGVLAVHAEDSHSEDERADVNRMIGALESYGNGLESVIDQRGRREKILVEQVRPFSEATRASLGKLLLEANELDLPAVVVRVGVALQGFASAEDHVLAYQMEPSGQAARRFQEVSASFSTALDAIEVSEFSKAGQERLRGIRKGIESWNRAVFQVVSSTRSFLHLVNVVLAGQALEFRTLSSRLTQGALKAQAKAERENQGERSRFRRLSEWFGILTVVAGIMAGWWISRSLSVPITEMTKTFSALAAGEQVEIAGAGRSDEIGELASAAKVFAERNRETRELLERADSLAQERDATNRELEDYVQELKLRNEDLDSFSYSASHDLRAPLRSISLLAEWIQEDAADVLPPESAENLETLVGRVNRLDAILDGLLAYARIGRTHDLEETFGVRALVVEVVEPWSANSSVQLSILGDEIEISAARVALHKVIQNLVSNAISHHDKAVGHVSIKIDTEDEFLVLCIEDDGPGIAESFHERVFQIFQTVKPRDVKEGSGIGLSIVQKIVHNASGTIELHSAPGEGSRFTVRWPLQGSKAGKAAAAARAGPEGPGRGAAK